MLHGGPRSGRQSRPITTLILNRSRGASSCVVRFTALTPRAFYSEAVQDVIAEAFDEAPPVAAADLSLTKSWWFLTNLCAIGRRRTGGGRWNV